jgi:outer membrane protein TolC
MRLSWGGLGLVGILGCVQTAAVVPTSDLSVSHSVAHETLSIAPGAETALTTEEHTDRFSPPQTLEDLIRLGLAENRRVQAAWYQVAALRERIPQVTALNDPVVSHTIYPVPSIAPQYSLMGYNPWAWMLTQQFPWFGTLRWRGTEAGHEAEVAVAELAAAQLDVVNQVKQAYHDLVFRQRSQEILSRNRELARDFRDIARSRMATGGTERDVLRAELTLDEIDRDLALIRQGLAEARAALIEQAHLDPDTPLVAFAPPEIADVPEQVDRLRALALATKPELRGRSAAIARDLATIEVARKRFYPEITLGISYMNMERTNAHSPTADGMPNVGMVFGLNLPIYRGKLHAGLREAQAQLAADARLLDAEQDTTIREIQDGLARVQSQTQILGILRDGTLPRARQILELNTAEYRSGDLGFDEVITSWREVLQVELLIAQTETERNKALANLERAVGTRINTQPPLAQGDSARTPNSPESDAESRPDDGGTLPPSAELPPQS